MEENVSQKHRKFSSTSTASSCSSANVFQPSLEDITTRRFRLRYCSATDTYYRQWSEQVCPQLSALECVDSGLLSSESVQREKDDKKAFLTLSSGAQSGFVTWKVDLSGSGLAFDSVSLVAVSGAKYGGQVVYHVAGDDGMISAPSLGGKEPVAIDDLSGSRTIKLTLFLSGNSENSQILPSALEDTMFCPLDIKASLKTLGRGHECPYVGELLLATKFTSAIVAQEYGAVSESRGRRKSVEVGVKQGSLQVQVVSGLNLAPVNVVSDKSDPYVKCYLLPDASRSTKCKTKVRKKELNPVWNEEFLFDGVSYSDLKQGALEVWVMDWNMALKNRVIGACRLSLGLADPQLARRAVSEKIPERRSSFSSMPTIFPWMDSTGSEVNQWKESLERPGEWIYCWHALRDEMTSGCR